MGLVGKRRAEFGSETTVEGASLADLDKRAIRFVDGCLGIKDYTELEVKRRELTVSSCLENKQCC